MNARVFVGQPLCRNRQWLDISVDFARCVHFASSYLKLIPSFVRPVIAPFLIHVRRNKKHERNAMRLLISEIERRRTETTEKGALPIASQDMIKVLERVSPPEENSPERIAIRQLGLIFAGTHGPPNLIVNVLYDLAARWSTYGEDLRSEIEEVLAECNGILSKSAFAKMSKLDSFMKESQRLSPSSACKMLQLSDQDRFWVHLVLMVLLCSVLFSQSPGAASAFNRGDYTAINHDCLSGGTYGIILGVSFFSKRV